MFLNQTVPFVTSATQRASFEQQDLHMLVFRQPARHGQPADPATQTMKS
jgi:hypothetical protein